MNNKRIAMLVMTAALIIALVAPIFVFQNRVAYNGTEGYQKLEYISRSLSGDRRFDLKAAEALSEVDTIINNELYRSKDKSGCYELNLKISKKPRMVSC